MHGSSTGVRLAWIALLVLCSSIYLCTAPGRIGYPDDEIVFQTTQSLVEQRNLAIEGIAKRTGERDDRPDGTFGWAPGREGQRYGFFGHGLSLVAVPGYLLADATVSRVPERWRYAIRPDLFTFHRRSLEADWTRLVVSLTNSLLTPLAALLLGLWLRALGYREHPAIYTALCYALATTAWPYAGTFLSEPLSTVVLLGAALELARWRRESPARTGSRRSRHLWTAAALAGLSVHVHLLNFLAIPCLLVYALLEPQARRAALGPERRSWVIALAIGAVIVVLLGLDHAWRFGSPFESGRYDHYGRWVWPFRGLLTMLVAPGRSLLIYSPPLVLALWWWPKLRRRDRAAAIFVLALGISRLVFVSCRSDWHGGWGIGPRYLVPIVPFLLVPLAELFERWSSLHLARRVAAAALLIFSVALQAWLAIHSIFQWMWKLNLEHGRERYMAIADWQPGASPAAGFWQLEQPALEFARAGKWTAARTSAQLDVLGFGAYRLAKATEADGLWWIMLGIGGVGVLAGAGLVVWLMWAARRGLGSPAQE